MNPFEPRYSIPGKTKHLYEVEVVEKHDDAPKHTRVFVDANTPTQAADFVAKMGWLVIETQLVDQMKSILDLIPDNAKDKDFTIDDMIADWNDELTFYLGLKPDSIISAGISFYHKECTVQDQIDFIKTAIISLKTWAGRE